MKDEYKKLIRLAKLQHSNLALVACLRALAEEVRKLSVKIEREPVLPLNKKQRLALVACLRQLDLTRDSLEDCLFKETKEV